MCIKEERELKGGEGRRQKKVYGRRVSQVGMLMCSHKSFFTQKDASRFRIRSTHVFFGFHRSPLSEKAMLVFEIAGLRHT